MAMPILAAVGFSKLLWVAAPHYKCESCNCELHSHSSTGCGWEDGSSNIGSACYANLHPKKAKSKVDTSYTRSMVWPSLHAHIHMHKHITGVGVSNHVLLIPSGCYGYALVHLWWPGTLNTLLKLGKAQSNLTLETMHIKSKNNKYYYCILQLNHYFTLIS